MHLLNTLHFYKFASHILTAAHQKKVPKVDITAPAGAKPGENLMNPKYKLRSYHNSQTERQHFTWQ